MASYTSNLNLKKPAGSENVAIGDINNNMDLIDSAYGDVNSKITRSSTKVNEVNGLNVYLCKHGCANMIYIQGTLTNAVSGSDTIDVCSTSDIAGLYFTNYIAGVEFNSKKVIGFYLSGGYVKMRISDGMSAGASFSGHVMWC